MIIHRPIARLALTAAVTLWASAVGAEEPEITELRGRVDTQQMFGKDRLERATSARRPTGKGAIDFDALLAAIDSGSGDPSPAWVTFATSDGEETGESNGKTLTVNRRTGSIRMRDSRGYTAASAARMTDANILARARPVLDALGALPDETHYEVHSLMAESRFTDGRPAVKEEMARKVFVSREVAGVPVETDHLVLSFTLDGSLRKISGNWHQIDFDRSQLGTALSDTEVTERAIKTIERQSLATMLSLASDGPVRVRTVFVATELADGQFVFVPKGRVDVPVVGPSGTLTTVFDFDM